MLGSWPAAQRVIDAPLEKNVLQSGERMVRVSREGKRAITEFRVLERFEGATLVEASPITGRTHQIRVHALHAGHPILGDPKYATDKADGLAASIGLRRLFLHAASLRFELEAGQPIVLEAPLGEELEGALSRLRN